MTTTNWLVATTRPHRESWAAENCAAQGFETYRPQVLTRRRFIPNQPHRFIAAPLFPNYMFVRMTEHWPRLLATFGISSVLRFGDKPSTVPDHLLQQLRQREINGLIQLPKPQAGQRVRIVRGALASHTGLYLGMAGHDRIKVLLDVVDRRLKVFVAADAVTLAA